MLGFPLFQIADISPLKPVREDLIHRAFLEPGRDLEGGVVDRQLEAVAGIVINHTVPLRNPPGRPAIPQPPSVLRLEPVPGYRGFGIRKPVFPPAVFCLGHRINRAGILDEELNPYRLKVFRFDPYPQQDAFPGFQGALWIAVREKSGIMRNNHIRSFHSAKWCKCQIRSLYSRIVRSELKKPDFAVLTTAIFIQPIGLR